MDAEGVWNKSLSLLENKLNRPAFEIFIKRIVPVSIDDTRLHLKIPGTLSMDYLGEYKSLIQDAVSSVIGKQLEIVATQDKTSPVPSPEPDNELTAGPRQQKKKKSTYLNPKYTFETFIVGASNRLCHAAALAVAEAPGKAYNPLFVYGGVGLGKTHIMQAIGHYTLETRPHLNVEYITTDAFIHEMMSFVQSGNLLNFRNRYQKSDILLMDDVQFIQGKERTQYEFFQIFNAFFEAKKQIVVTCDRLPKEIPTLEDRMVSRLNWGLIADIKPPDFETRLAILRKKIELDETSDIPESVLELIAETVTTNIRDLEGTLNRVVAYANLSKREVSLPLTEEIIRDIVPSKDTSSINVKNILKEVSSYYGVDVDDLLGQRRKKEIVAPRMVAMYLARDMTGLSLSQIGKDIGNKDHSSVLYACEKIEKEMKKDPSLRLGVENLKDKLSR